MEVLSPVVSSKIEYQTSPVVEPPATEFPYPEKDSLKQRTDRSRQDSEATLTGNDDITPDGNAKGDAKNPKFTRSTSFPSINAPFTRPSLVSQKFETEIVKPVGIRPHITAKDRQSTDGVSRGSPRSSRQSRLDNNAISNEQNQSSWSGVLSSDEEDNHRPAASKRTKTRQNLHKSHLNRIKRATRRDDVSISNNHFRSHGRIARDGRLNISVNETANSGYLAKALGATIRGHLHPHAQQDAINAEDTKKQYSMSKSSKNIPRMNIVIMVIGSRGDIQPFLKIGQILRDKYHHRVRIATHPTFREFVEKEMKLEFFSVGGDPSELMSFMVKNPGLVPSFETLTSGEIGRRREQMYEMFQGFWRACINTTDDEKDITNLKMLGDKFPFVADAIIANPPSFAHFHCAERLGIPLHLVFTFPYTPTTSFPHPLANIKASNVDREYTNYMSYPLVDLMTWQGLGDLVNRFRVKTLGLEPVSTLWAPGQMSRLKVPMTYLWSPGLVPKPADWGPEIDIAGYVFLDLGSTFDPPEDLMTFLDRSENSDQAIVYIGFGSISGIDDPRAFCQMIFDAVVKANVRAIVSRGWGGMGDGMDIPDDVFMIDNVPHDWLFPKVDAVIHHGGAGTTAAGLKFGKPTMIVPFFGDQPFWASEIAKIGAGAREALPLKYLDSDKFATGILECLEEETKQKAQEIAKSIEEEGDGAENAVDSFHRSLALDGKHSMRCGIFEDRTAVWKVRNTSMQLSALAADLLVDNKQIKWSDLSLVRHKAWTDFKGPGEPITGVGGVVMSAFQEAVHGITNIDDDIKKDMKKIDKRKRRGKTVADGVVLPARMAQKARAASATSSQPTVVPSSVNMHGEAEPHRLAVFRESEDEQTSDARPTILRSYTAEAHPKDNFAAPMAIARDVGKGLGHSTKAITTMPLEIMNAITLGFRNAPRLYGDKTVRPPPPAIKGFRAGFITASKELWFGFYDGTTGIVKIPYLDLQQDGYSALPKGIARGFGGFLLKPLAGILGLPTYTTKGALASVRKMLRDTKKTERWLRRARMQQGAKDTIELKRKKENGQLEPITSVSRREGQLEQARSHVLQRWTSREQQLVEKARERERSVIARQFQIDQGVIE